MWESMSCAFRIRFFFLSVSLFSALNEIVRVVHIFFLLICSVKIKLRVAGLYRKVNMFMILYLSDCNKLKCIQHHCNRTIALHFNLFGLLFKHNKRIFFTLEIINMVHSLTHVTTEYWWVRLFYHFSRKRITTKKNLS